MLSTESETAEALNPGRFDVQAGCNSRHVPRNHFGCRTYSTFPAHLESTFPFSDRVMCGTGPCPVEATAYGRRQANEPKPRSSQTCERAMSRPDNPRRDANGRSITAGHSEFGESTERRESSDVGFTAVWRGQWINERATPTQRLREIAGNRGRVS